MTSHDDIIAKIKTDFSKLIFIDNDNGAIKTSISLMTNDQAQDLETMVEHEMDFTGSHEILMIRIVDGHLSVTAAGLISDSVAHDVRTQMTKNGI